MSAASAGFLVAGLAALFRQVELGRANGRGGGFGWGARGPGGTVALTGARSRGDAAAGGGEPPDGGQAPRYSPALGLAALAVVLANPTLSLHARTAEVYAPTAALVVWSWVAVAAARPLWAGALAGLLVGFHGASAAMPAIAACWCARPQGVGPPATARGPIRLVAGAVCVAALVGLLVIAYLPIRAAAEPWRNWGDPSSFGALLDHLTGARIRAAYASDMGAWSRLALTVPMALRQLYDQCGALVVFAPLAVFALPRRVGAVLALTLAADLAYTALLNPMGMRDLQTGTLAATALCALALAGAGSLFLPFGRPGIFIGVVGGLAAITTPAEAVVSDTRAAELAVLALDELPIGAVALVGSDDLAASTTFVQGVEGARPDVVTLVKQHLQDPTARAAAVRADGLGRLAPWPPLSALLSGTVGVELSDGAIDGRLVGWAPSLPLLRPGATEPLFASFEHALRRLGVHDDEGRRVVARWLALAGTFAGRSGPSPDADRAIEAAWALAHQARVGVNEGARLTAAGQIDDARVVLTEAVRLDPLSVKAWFNRGVVDAFCGDTRAAREAFASALRLGLGRSRAARALEVLGLQEANLGRTGRALLLLEVAHEALPVSRRAENEANLSRLRAQVLAP